jgi:pimeloyl-ACP methyl ester carboxylesterase
MIRRHVLIVLAVAALLGACSTPATPPAQPPIVFVHGNGDTAALWTTTLWRFESNGWPRDRLHAIDLPYPLARDEDNVAQPGRTSTTEHAQFLSSEVDKVLARTGASQVVLVGNSRGGNAIRNYVQNFGGASKVSMAVLGGTPNHGVWALQDFRPNSEFNGVSPFLVALNAPKGANGDEVTPGERWLTIRSDNNDKFAQPDGVWIGAKGKPTNVTFDSPALKGAKNVVLPQRDHREVSFHAEAFAQTYEFITGRPAATLTIAGESRPVLDGKLSGIGPAGPSNLPLVGATLEVFAVNAGTGARQGCRTPPQGDRRRRPLGSVRGRQRHDLRICRQRAGLCHHAHLPLALRALQRHRQPACRAPGRGRQGGGGSGHDEPATRLLRRAARPRHARRRHTRTGHPRRRGRRVQFQDQAEQRQRPTGGGRLCIGCPPGAHRRPGLARRRKPRGATRADELSPAAYLGLAS